MLIIVSFVSREHSTYDYSINVRYLFHEHALSIEVENHLNEFCCYRDKKQYAFLCKAKKKKKKLKKFLLLFRIIKYLSYRAIRKVSV